MKTHNHIQPTMTWVAGPNHLLENLNLCLSSIINHQMTLVTLYIYDDINAYLEYPNTSATQLVGYLFRCDLHNWENLTHCFAYSVRKLSGWTRKGEEVVSALLTVEDGNKVSSSCWISWGIARNDSLMDIRSTWQPSQRFVSAYWMSLH